MVAGENPLNGNASHRMMKDMISSSQWELPCCNTWSCTEKYSMPLRWRRGVANHVKISEYETPNFEIITSPEDFALVSALYRSSIDGRRFMYEAILSPDGEYNIPDTFTSRSVEVLQTYLKSLGVRMETIFDEDEFIGEPEYADTTIGYEVGNTTIFCTIDEMYYLKKLQKVYKRYLKEHPKTIDDADEVWDYIMEHLPFKKKHLTDHIIELFRNNLEAFGMKKQL